MRQPDRSSSAFAVQYEGEVPASFFSFNGEAEAPASPARPGREARRVSEYERCGMANVFCAVEPKAGRHFTFPTPNRSAVSSLPISPRILHAPHTTQCGVATRPAAVCPWPPATVQSDFSDPQKPPEQPPVDACWIISFMYLIVQFICWTLYQPTGPQPQKARSHFFHTGWHRRDSSGICRRRIARSFWNYAEPARRAPQCERRPHALGSASTLQKPIKPG